MAVYHRVLLKLSGEALKSDKDLFNFEKVNHTLSKRVHKAYLKFWSIIHSIYGGAK